jgi:orotate phosphoribosyltransferase
MESRALESAGNTDRKNIRSLIGEFMTVDVLEKLDHAGAVLLDQHFVYKSGKHGSGYINLDPIFPDVALMHEICGLLVEPFRGEVETIAAPAVGGVALAVISALAASKSEGQIAAVWADKHGDDFIFERAGFVERITGKKVLVVEDLLTTGGSALKVCQAVKAHGGEVVGLSVICNRGGVTAEQLGVPRLESLANVNFSAIEADACPLCADGVPIVEDIGHGAAYKAEHPNYEGGYISLVSRSTVR